LTKLVVARVVGPRALSGDVCGGQLALVLSARERARGTAVDAKAFEGFKDRGTGHVGRCGRGAI
jgi:hypothetical protein